ncbi:hypothetical protein LCGC14_1026290 [marine sediment metagenome]|uniref:Uncharacterized protein n=1 Tax=marine sediment metagenome TaxID=412755 RepID=A0A0F9NHM5_9ZZZZ
MKVQIGKMILYGVLTTVFYIAVPLILFEILGTLNIMTFSQAFRISIIIIGIIGVVISMLRHLFPTDTSANRLVAFGATVYSGIYLFYMFGGFTPGVSLGTYAITLPTIQVLLGLQLIAWLLLASSGIRALQYLIEAIEIGKKKEYSVTVRRKFKLSMVFKALGTVMGLVIAGYFGSLVYSGVNLGFDIHDTFGVDYDDGGTPFPLISDDTINLTMSFDVSNQGLYAIYGVIIAVRFYTVSTANPVDLPENTKIGESLNNFYSTFHAFTVTPDNNITVIIDPTYAEGFITTDAVLEFQISFSTLYAGILVNLNMSIQTPWTAII